MNTNIGKFINKFSKRKSTLTIPEVAVIGGTRALLGAGVGLLLANKLKGNPRNAVGVALLLVGAASTIPIARNIFAKSK
jgi:hypothetical protein